MENQGTLWQKLRLTNVFVQLSVAFVCLLLFGSLVEKNILFRKFDQRHASRIQSIFTEKERAVKHCMNALAQCTADGNTNRCLLEFHDRYSEFLAENGLYLFLYRSNTLQYWSSRDAAVPEIYSPQTLGVPYVSLGNNMFSSKYASFTVEVGEHTIVGLMLVKNVYVYENRYLRTAFQKDFDLPDDVKIFPEQTSDYYPVVDSSGRLMWSLIFDGTSSYTYQIYIPALAYLLATVVFLMLLNSIFGILRTACAKNLYFPVLAFILVTVRFAMQHWQIPEVFGKLSIFTPEYFGSSWFPSLGELCLWSAFACFFSIEIFRFLQFPLFYERRWKYFGYVCISLAAVTVVFFAASALMHVLVVNSSGMFETANSRSLVSGTGLLGYTVIMMLLISFCLLLDRVIQLCRQELNLQQYLILCATVLSAVIIVWSIAGLHLSLLSVFFLSVMFILMGILRLKRNVSFRYSHYILTVFILSLFTTIYIYRSGREKLADEQKLLVTNLASHNDLTAEFLLKDISERIISDAEGLAYPVYTDFHIGNDYSNVLTYVKRQYFYSSYWNNYIFRCWVCDDWERLRLGQQPRTENCIQYFKNMTETIGTQLPRTAFWYIESPNELSRYMGWFRLTANGEPPLHLFIEFWPAGNPDDEIGYPELLLDERLIADNNLKGYSYAKYRNGRIITQYGNYRYNLRDDIFQTGGNDYHTVYSGGMKHLVYRPDGNSIIVLSSYAPGPGDHIVSFSYIFIFSLTAVSIILLIVYTPVIRQRFHMNFRNKIQYTMIAVMLVSFAIIGIFTLYYVNRQYIRKNTDIIDEKITAIHSELLESILYYENTDENSSEYREMLSGWLSEFQRIFRTDINLFDAHGILIATSLPDIFERGLVGHQINTNAYLKLSSGQQSYMLEREKIGELHYISAYMPFLDSENRIIAYLNLPYFTQHNALIEEISSVVIALINFYIVITLLTVIVSFLISNQITRPLIMLQEKFRNIRLGSNNEPVLYNSRDELGELVREYNRAIDELARSAARLARSERESAWREMARQIAHEINNPLTPMKLSVQHLKRAYDNKSERFDMYMEKISHSLVEQIDALSAIATEFSSFAKMPEAKNEHFDLISRLNSVIPLFAIDDNKQAFHTDFHGLDHVMIYADREQISRVFINLFKNSLQAMPKGRQVEIHIDILKMNRMVWIRIKDNGAGIPEEAQEKLFLPNFTTKSSGMGVGLYIVRSIIEGAGGTISFRTGNDKGTAFIISLPSA